MFRRRGRLLCRGAVGQRQPRGVSGNGRIGVAGESAEGNLAAVMALMARDQRRTGTRFSRFDLSGNRLLYVAGLLR